jgi:tetratricopeptide (TPR) repeat protein
MGDRDMSEARYRAFLSYSHRDAAAAGRLHRRLEAYRIPRRLAGRETPRGPVPARLWPIFRDREELPAATDLSETVREALAESGALIVLCSPNAAASLWVAEEIRVFRELHPGRPILAAVLEGDPPDCFPPVLRAQGDGHEPLATDLRRDRDGERLGLLKLVAGITGLGLDDLVQRDATRRVRRVMAVTAGAVAAMLVMAVLALVAIGARQEAERQRAEAEGQIEFMLTDLRDRLWGYGSVRVMQAVNAQALAYYGRQGNLDGLPADSLLRRARVLKAIGEDELTHGRADPALAAFLEARRTTAAQLAQAPDDPERQLEHARSEMWIGRVYEARREWGPAQQQYRLFAIATEALLAREPDNPVYLNEAAWSALNLGNLYLSGTPDYAAAQRHYEQAIHRFERAIVVQPSDADAPRVLANAYAYLADSFYMRRMWGQSLAARERQYHLVERLQRTQPDNVEYGFRLAAAQRGITRSLYQLGDRARARAELLRAFGWARQLTARDPANAEWRLFRAMVDCDFIFLGLGDPPGETQAGLRRDFHAIANALTAERNPRVSEISRCVAAMARGGATATANGR